MIASRYQMHNSPSLSRNRYRSAMDGIGKRLTQARVARGYTSIASAARAFGWHKQNVADHEAERRRVSPEQAREYAQAYGVDASWLLYGGAAPRPAMKGRVPIIGKVGADPEGRVLFADGQAPNEFLDPPPGHTDRASALEVAGHSMHGFADDGSLIFFEDQHTAPLREQIGRVVVVELDTGEVLVKRLLKGDERDRWDLESINGPLRENVRLNWVATITAIILPPKSRELMRYTTGARIA